MHAFSKCFCCSLLQLFEKPAIAVAVPAGIVHGFAGVIGGMFPAPHGSVCAALLVPGTRMNLKVTASCAAARTAANPLLTLPLVTQSHTLTTC